MTYQGQMRPLGKWRGGIFDSDECYCTVYLHPTLKILFKLTEVLLPRMLSYNMK
jgi:hypothetical protein